MKIQLLNQHSKWSQSQGESFTSARAGLPCHLDCRLLWHLLLSFPTLEQQGSLLLGEQEKDVEKRETSHLSSVQQRGWEVVREEGAQAKWFIYRDLPLDQ